MLAELYDADAIVEAAEEAAGTRDLWGDAWRPGFEALVAALAAEAGLYPARAWRVLRWILEMLEMRARIAAALGDAPDRPVSGLERPIFITGLPRTGTTLLHNLMSSLPGLRALRPWEMRHVVPPPGAAPGWEQAAIADTDAELRALYERAPEFARIHPMSATAPDECHWLLRHAFASLIYAYMFHVPSYMRWETSRPQREAYLELRAELGLFLGRRPAGRLVMKDPGHLWHLDALLDAFPDAVVVRLHRDPRKAVPSLASLVFCLQRMDSARTDPREAGAYVVEMVERGLAAERRAREARPGASILDIDYEDLVGDPVGTVERIGQTAGEPIGPAGVGAMSAWLGEHPQHKAGRHVYTAEQFGLSPGALVERFGERG